MVGMARVCVVMQTVLGKTEDRRRSTLSGNGRGAGARTCTPRRIGQTARGQRFHPACGSSRWPRPSQACHKPRQSRAARLASGGIAPFRCATSDASADQVSSWQGQPSGVVAGPPGRWPRQGRFQQSKTRKMPNPRMASQCLMSRSSTRGRLPPGLRLAHGSCRPTECRSDRCKKAS